MSYEDTDYRRRQDPTTGGVQGRVPGDRRQPVDMPTRGGSTKGLLIAAVAIVAFIVIISLMSVGSNTTDVAPGMEGEATQTVPEEGISGGVQSDTAPAAPALGDETAPAQTAPTQGQTDTAPAEPTLGD